MMQRVPLSMILLIILCVTSFSYAQSIKDEFKTMQSFYSTTYIKMDLVKKKDILVEIIDFETKESVFSRVYPNIKKTEFKLYLGNIPKGKYIMEFRNDKKEVLKEFIVNKVE